MKYATPSFPPLAASLPNRVCVRTAAVLLFSFFCVLAPAQTQSTVRATGKAIATSEVPGDIGAKLTSTPLSFPRGFVKSIKDYGAVGNGVTDDTFAILTALNEARSNSTGDYNGLPKALYFPPGVYLVNDTLKWNGCCVLLQGAGPSASIIRLAPYSAGFQDASHPKPLLQTPAGISSFRQNIWDIGFVVGAGNPGAIGLDYVSNNNGGVHDVSIVSEDGQGVVGLSMTRFYAGPLMLKNLKITGFQKGIATAAYEYGSTIEGLTLSKQSVAGIYNLQQTISIRGLQSDNSVPALMNIGGFALVLDATLTGGSSNATAIYSTGGLYLRNIAQLGYGNTLQDASVSTPVRLTGVIGEYSAGTSSGLLSSPSSHSLNLAVAETPVYIDQDLSRWTPFLPVYYGDTKYLQSTLDQGTSTIYFPFGRYLAYNEVAVTVPDHVNRIVGFSSVVNRSPAGVNGGGIRFIVNSNVTTPLIIEQFGYGVKIDHYGKRPVVIKDGGYSYTSHPGAGDVFFEDVVLPQVTFQAGQSVWARQLDDEVADTKIINEGTLWIMGLKTEQGGTVIQTAAGGSTEVLGNLIYPAKAVNSNTIAFQSTDARVSCIYTQSVYCPACGYSVQVAESRNGRSARLTSANSKRFVMHLFVGY